MAGSLATRGRQKQSSSGSVAGQEVGRAQPQTTVETETGGPFIRYSQPGRAPMYARTADALGGIITQPLVARPGYLRNLRVLSATVTGGTITSGTVQADAPYNLFTLVQFKDSFGTPIVVADGYSVTKLIQLIGGHFGLDNTTNDPINLPSFSALSATTAASQFAWALPIEFTKAYGVISGANASLLPTLQLNLNTLAALLSSSATGTAPTVNTTVDTDFYWLPEGVDISPPGLGTSRQWLLQQANPTIGASAAARPVFPRLGGYLDTVAMIIRGSTGARDDGYWPTRLQLYVDGVPLIDSLTTELQDDWTIQYGNVTRPSGVHAITRKTSLNQKTMGLLDSGESFLSTNPGTLLEANFAPAGAGSNSPGTMSVLIGQIVPTGSIIQGLPEL